MWYFRQHAVDSEKRPSELCSKHVVKAKSAPYPPWTSAAGGPVPPYPPPHTPHTPNPSESCRGSSHQEGHVSGSLHRTVSKDAGYRHVPWGLRSAEFYRSSNFTAVQVFRTPSQHAPLQVCWARALSLVIPLPHFQKKTSHKHKKIAPFLATVYTRGQF